MGGQIYVADSGNDRIHRFNSDGNFVLALAAATAPPAPTSSFNGLGNAKSKPTSCREGRVKRKGRCVARKPRKQQSRKHTWRKESSR